MLKREWLLCLSAFGLLVSSIALVRIPAYSLGDLEILYILFVLFVTTTGLHRHGVLVKVAASMERGRFSGAKLVLGTFFLSMVVTNDVALLTIVPLTMLLRIENKQWLVILEALAANAGSAISPFGSPQNLFIYWFYEVPFTQFVAAVAPLSMFFLLLLLAASVVGGKQEALPGSSERKELSAAAWGYLLALVVFALAILRVVPLHVGWIIVACAALWDRGSLRVDYALLGTFACFFGFADNLRAVLADVLPHSHHVFFLAAALSQLLSNVPAALLLGDFTKHWRPLLWGVTVGGFGNLLGSLANVIAYRIFSRAEPQQSTAFLVKFHAVGYGAFALGVLFYVFFGPR